MKRPAGFSAIDPTLPDAPEPEYFGIEFPFELVAQLISRDGYVSPLLADAEIVAILETAADAAEAQAALRILDASDDKGGSLERAGFRKLGIEGPSPAARPSGSKRSDGASISIRRRSNECLY
jgi:hypothetical protein